MKKIFTYSHLFNPLFPEAKHYAHYCALNIFDTNK